MDLKKIINHYGNTKISNECDVAESTVSNWKAGRYSPNQKHRMKLRTLEARMIKRIEKANVLNKVAVKPEYKQACKKYDMTKELVKNNYNKLTFLQRLKLWVGV